MRSKDSNGIKSISRAKRAARTCFLFKFDSAFPTRRINRPNSIEQRVARFFLPSGKGKTEASPHFPAVRREITRPLDTYEDRFEWQ